MKTTRLKKSIVNRGILLELNESETPLSGRRSQDAILRDVLVEQIYTNFVSKQYLYKKFTFDKHIIMEVKKERVIAYVDGFNLYFGMVQKGPKDTLWLNIQELAKSLLKPNQELIYTKYFTSRVRNSPDKEMRQKTYIEAIETLPNCKIYYGNYQNNTVECFRCGHTYSSPKEKMTDVNIAVEMMTDAHNDTYDTAMLITGDSDLVPPIKAIHNIFHPKRVFVAFPPNRHNLSLSTAAKGSIIIGKATLKNAQFTDTVIKADGFILKKPAKWV